MELADFAFRLLPQIPRPRGLSAAPPLGLLQDLKGTWQGTGFNVIWRPNNTLGQDHFLELNLTEETLQFEEIPGPIPNRGLLQDKIDMFGLWYLQKIEDQILKATGQPAGLHIEPGIWATVPSTQHPNVGATVVRMASIPHGTTVNAQGTATSIATAPEITDISITPFFISNPAKTQPFDESDLLKSSAFRTPVVLNVSSSSSNPVPGGGVANTAFLQGSSDEGPNAKAALVTATFWIETIEGAAGGPDVQQLQYTQTVLLNFNGLSWPHVSVATLQKVSPGEQPVGIEPLSVRDI
jgi:hypothetical protein